MQSVIISSNQAGQRLDKFLHKFMPEAGNGFLYKMLRKKNITLNGKKAEGSEILSLGDTITFFFSEETYQKFTGLSTETGEKCSKESISLSEYKNAYDTLHGIEIIYEDDNILIANKPTGILSQKSGRKDVSLNEWLIGYLLSRNPGFQAELHTFRPSVCNRLDRNTSGIVLCGKSLAGSQYLSKCIKERNIAKFYRTVCVGNLNQDASIKGYLVKDTVRNKVSVFGTPDDFNKQDAIETKYHPIALKNKYTFLEVELITGKTHQIRAHLASIGCPLIGDYKYGDRKTNDLLKEKFQLNYQLLHAYRVVFPECRQGIGAALSKKEFCAPYPQEFRKIIAELGF